MIHFRVAIRMDELSQWRWKSSILSTPGTLFNYLTMYDCVPRDRLRIFFATSMGFMNEMLVRENSGLVSNSTTVEDFLNDGKRIDVNHIVQLEHELGLIEDIELIAKPAGTGPLRDEHPSLHTISPFEQTLSTISETSENNWNSLLNGPVQEASEWSIGGDCDTPYIFELPISMPQALAWARLLAKVQCGELIP